MKFMIIFFLAALATGGADDCVEEKAEECVTGLVLSMLDDSVDEEVCGELSNSLGCLSGVAQECGEDADVQQGLQELKQIIDANCGGSERRKRDNEECFEEKGVPCVERFLMIVFTDTPEDEICGELSASVSCLQNVAPECGGVTDQELEEGLQELRNLVDDICEDESRKKRDSQEDEELAECLDDIGDIIAVCTGLGQETVVPLLIENNIKDENSMTCVIYAFIGECVADTLEEQCGEEAGKLVRDEIEDPPENIVKACEAVDQSLLNEIESLKKKKK